MNPAANIHVLAALLKLNATREHTLHRRHRRLLHIQAGLRTRAAAWRRIRHSDERRSRQALHDDWHVAWGGQVTTTTLAALASDKAWHAWALQQAAEREQRWQSRFHRCASHCRDIGSQLQASRKRRLTLDAMKCRLETLQIRQRDQLDEDTAMDIAAARHARRP